MRVRSIDGLIKALRLLQQAARSQDAAGIHSLPATISFDLGELFLEELRARRKRLQEWIRLLNDQAGRDSEGAVASPCRSRTATPARKRKSRAHAA